MLVQDNLNIHSKASLYEAFPASEARRLVERFEWHYTPKHGSWLKGTSIYSDFECCGERRNCKLRFFHGVGCSSAYASA